MKPSRSLTRDVPSWAAAAKDGTRRVTSVTDWRRESGRNATATGTAFTREIAVTITTKFAQVRDRNFNRENFFDPRLYSTDIFFQQF